MLSWCCIVSFKFVVLLLYSIDLDFLSLYCIFFIPDLYCFALFYIYVFIVKIDNDIIYNVQILLYYFFSFNLDKGVQIPILLINNEIEISSFFKLIGINRNTSVSQEKQNYFNTNIFTSGQGSSLVSTFVLCMHIIWYTFY